MSGMSEQTKDKKVDYLEEKKINLLIKYLSKKQPRILNLPIEVILITNHFLFNHLSSHYCMIIIQSDTYCTDIENYIL